MARRQSARSLGPFRQCGPKVAATPPSGPRWQSVPLLRHPGGPEKHTGGRTGSCGARARAPHDRPRYGWPCSRDAKAMGSRGRCPPGLTCAKACRAARHRGSCRAATSLLAAGCLPHFCRQRPTSCPAETGSSRRGVDFGQSLVQRDPAATKPTMVSPTRPAGPIFPNPQDCPF